MVSLKYCLSETDPVALAHSLFKDQDFALESETDNPKDLWWDAYHSARWYINGQYEKDFNEFLATMNPNYQLSQDVPF